TLKHETQALPYLSFVLENMDRNEHGFYYQRSAAISFSKILIKTGKPEEGLSSYKKIMEEYPAKQGSLEHSTDKYYLGDIYFSLKKFDEAERLFLGMLDHNDTTPSA